MINNEGKSFSFRLSNSDATDIPDAETLFRDLKNRDPSIQHLWSHQADIIRAYHKEDNKKDRGKDIALELPTGTGKTLVGLLIAEWRRRTKGERVVYLCPTRQLAYQVGEKTRDYGIPAHVFVGQQNQYNPSEFSAYAAAQAIAVTTYSGLFNTNPRIKDPETIILDDAHASENYISSMWSLTVNRLDHSDLYSQIRGLYLEDLPEYLVPDLLDDSPTLREKKGLDLLPGPKYVRKLSALADLLNAGCNSDNALVYPWRLIRSNLMACAVFFSWGEILIRPLVPPSLRHRPFAGATQRIYMSATLGAAGDLERIIGLPNICRIPAPSGWDKQSTGRRLFIFPDMAFTKEEYKPWLAGFIDSVDRSLVLTPNRYDLEAFASFITDAGVQHDILRSHDIETSLQSFTDKSKAILLLTNRYDGIDLPDSACRVLIVYGLPTSVNLLERFLWSKLGASLVLRDRIRTRLTQAVGRCTRGSTDYAVLLMVGEDLFDFCIKRESKAELHPELRAEMEFGLDNSDVGSITDLESLAHLFLSRDPQWSAAENDIAKRRNAAGVALQPHAKVLREAAKLEVLFQYDLWKEDYEAALEKATRISDSLSGDDLSGYRAWWRYWSGCAAYYLGFKVNDENMIQKASRNFYRASQASTSISWFAKLSHEIALKDPVDEESTSVENIVVNGVNNYLEHLGYVGGKFEKIVGKYRNYIYMNDADNFDTGLTELGKMLGYEAEKPDGQGVPDSIWKLGSQYFVFESKSEEKPENGISVRTCRQAQGHSMWLKNREQFSTKTKIWTIIVSPRSYLDDEAIPHANGLHYLKVKEIRKLFSTAESCLRIIRSKSADLESERRLQVIQTEFSQADLATSTHLLKTPLDKLVQA